MDGSVDGLDAAIGVGFRTTDCLLDSAAAFDDDLAFGSVDAEDRAFFAFVVTGNDADLVALFDVCLDGAHKRKFLGLENLGCEGNDLHELFFTKFACNRSEDAGAARVVVFVDQNDGVRIETEDRSIGATDREGGANDYRLHHTALFDGGCGDRIADVSGDHITDAGGAAALAENSDHFSGAGARVVSNSELCFHLNHGSGVVELGELFSER